MILRSAFWLAVGFAVVAPHGTDFGAAASAARSQAISAGLQVGEQLIATQILLGLSASTAALSGSKPSTPSVDSPMQDLPTASFVFPRPRPAAMG
jgi:hypothetical protein